MAKDNRINQNELVFTLTLNVECLSDGHFTHRIQINCSSDSIWDVQRGCTIVKTYIPITCTINECRIGCKSKVKRPIITIVILCFVKK